MGIDSNDLLIDFGDRETPEFELKNLGPESCVNNFEMHTHIDLPVGAFTITFRVANAEIEAVLETFSFPFDIVKPVAPITPAPVANLPTSTLWAGEAELGDRETGTCDGTPCADNIRLGIEYMVKNSKGEVSLLDEQLNIVKGKVITFTPSANDVSNGTFRLSCDDPRQLPTEGEYSIRKGYLGFRLTEDKNNTTYMNWYPQGVHGDFPVSKDIKCSFRRGFVAI